MIKATHTIQKGWGFDVGQDFARAKENTPVELSEGEYGKPGCVIGYIAADPNAALGFLKYGTNGKIRVHVQRQALSEIKAEPRRDENRSEPTNNVAREDNAELITRLLNSAHAGLSRTLRDVLDRLNCANVRAKNAGVLGFRTDDVEQLIAILDGKEAS